LDRHSEDWRAFRRLAYEARQVVRPQVSVGDFSPLADKAKEAFEIAPVGRRNDERQESTSDIRLKIGLWLQT
jgi:hypothetical protein